MPDGLRAELRRSYRCGCDGEAWPRLPYRVTLAVLESDAGEQVLTSCSEATGTRPATCPWASFADPYVAEVIRAHRWWKAGELSTRYGRVPLRIVEGIEVYDAALNAVQVHDMREDREKRADEARKRETSLLVQSR